jgi:predicted metalloprotease with PDZ domain
MRWLYANHDARARRYGLDDLIRGLKSASGLDYSTFMGRYVEGTEVLPLREYLDLGDAALGEYRHLAVDALTARGRRPAVQLPPLDPALAAALGLPTIRRHQ